jgi:hypothetical protein
MEDDEVKEFVKERCGNSAQVLEALTTHLLAQPSQTTTCPLTTLNA